MDRRSALVALGALATPWAASATPSRRSAHPLFDAYPSLAVGLPHVPLTQLPTPIEPAPRLAAALGIGELWLKRDDRSAADFAGGKPRKLELVVGAARAAGAERLISAGGLGSNQAVALAIAGKRVGIPVTLLLLPQTPSAWVRRNVLLALQHGAEIRFGSRFPEQQARDLAKARREHAVWIPPGASTPLGNVGFVDAGFELALQLQAKAAPPPDLVVVAAGSLGSAVGIALGARAAGRPLEVLAVRCSDPEHSTPKVLAQQWSDVVRVLRAHSRFPELSPVQFPIAEEQLGRGYGYDTERAKRVVRLAADTEGLRLDPVYVGKALAAISKRSEKLTRSRVLLWLSHDDQPLSVPEDQREPLIRKLPPELRGYGRYEK